MIVVEGLLIAFFVLAMLGVLLYTIITSRPDPSRTPHGADAINDAIDRFDRAQRSRTVGLFGGVASPMPPVVNVRMRRRRRRLHRSRHPGDM